MYNYDFKKENIYILPVCKNKIEKGKRRQWNPEIKGRQACMVMVYNISTSVETRCF